MTLVLRKYISLTVIALMALLPARADQTEPTTSVLATGKWVKVRVESDGVYQLTDAELRALGFSSPERVGVYGYPPNLLLTHDFDVMPTDLRRVASVHDRGKLVFYGKANMDLEPEIWRFEKFKASATQTVEEYPIPSQFEHIRHVFSRGAAYFLSDADPTAFEPAVISAPSAPEEPAATTHIAIVHNERDINQFGYGGTLFTGEKIERAEQTVTYPFSVGKVADEGLARIIYQGLDKSGGKNAPLLTVFSGGIKTQPAVGAQMSTVATSTTHQLYGLYRRFQNIQLPEEQEKRDYTLTFGVNPEFTNFSMSAIDYWTLLYSRHNDLEGETQLTMCFNPATATGGKRFAVSNVAAGSDWRFWDVTDPLEVMECKMAQGADGSLVGTFRRMPEEFAATYVTAFDMAATQPSPEIVGAVSNQNLHSMSTPDAVVLTSAMLADAAEEVADLHRRLQGMEVAVVDQELIFNEYGSGNVSPESVRRFLAHLDRKTPGKLKAMIIVGPAAADNAKCISPDAPFVVTAQNESDDDSAFQVRSLYSDSFYGRFGGLLQTGNWGVRHRFYQVLGNEMDIAVGRLPFINAADISAYVRKAEDYMTAGRTVPSMGTVIAASDYEGSSNAAMHYADCERVINPLSNRFGKELTLVRPASNFLSKSNTQMMRRIYQNAVDFGADLMVYFGHGRPDGLGALGNDLFLTITSAESHTSPGRYPFGFFGSCNTARCDVNPNNVTTALLRNEHGGMIGLVASTREVFQQENGVLGLQFIKEYDAAADGDTWGEIYARAQSNAVTAAALNRRTVINHLCYTFLGDPLIPVRKAARSVKIDGVNNGEKTLYARASNTISGTVCNSAGEVDAEFDGTLILTIYDAPTERKNLVAQGNTSAVEYLAQISEDNNVLKQITAEVKKGKFSVEFNAPTPTLSGTQRIQAYAYNKSGTASALGYISGLTTTDDSNRRTLPSKGVIAIRSMEADNAGFDSTGSGEAVIEAEIYAPNGFHGAGVIGQPVRFSIDGVSHPEVARQLTYIGDNTYRLTYVTGHLRSGRHVVDLYVSDDHGGEDSHSLEFAVNDAPEVEIEAECIGDGRVRVNCVGAEQSAEVRVIVENLHGDLIKSVTTGSVPVIIDGMETGVYRIYTQHRGERFYTSSPKTIVIVPQR